jgi:hypothetical protein
VASARVMANLPTWCWQSLALKVQSWHEPPSVGLRCQKEKEKN